MCTLSFSSEQLWEGVSVQEMKEALNSVLPDYDPILQGAVCVEVDWNTECFGDSIEYQGSAEIAMPNGCTHEILFTIQEDGCESWVDLERS